MPAQNRANRCGNFARRKTGRGDLIEQRLKCVMISAIYDSDLRSGADQRFGCVQPTEARSYDHHAIVAVMCSLAVHRSTL